MQFATKLGVIATTVGSAVGLGNIWRFPYEAGVHGGGAFLLIDLLFVFIVGVPVVCAEFIIGRHTGSNIRGAMRRLAPNGAWGILSFISLLSSILILSFYSVVAGWTMDYILRSFTDFSSGQTAAQLSADFGAFATSDWQPVLWTLLFLLCNYFVIARGVQSGIEKACNWLMPMFFMLLAIFTVHSLMLPEAAKGLRFLFAPDFSKATPDVWLGAMGQAFFSLSLGLGCLVTYSSYFSRQTPLMRSAATMATLDMLVAVLAGVIIFPAVFSYGFTPQAGPQLVFETLPAIFSNMAGGIWWSAAFFILLFMASLTSTISMSEITVAYIVEEHGLSRRKATMVTIAIAMFLGTLCALSFGSLSTWTICGKTLFDLFDFVSSNVLLPIGGLIISVFVGWVLERSVVYGELTEGHPRGSLFAARAVVFCLKYIAPVCISLVFICGLL